MIGASSVCSRAMYTRKAARPFALSSDKTGHVPHHASDDVGERASSAQNVPCQADPLRNEQGAQSAGHLSSATEKPSRVSASMVNGARSVSPPPIGRTCSSIEKQSFGPSRCIVIYPVHTVHFVFHRDVSEANTAFTIWE